MNEVSDNDKGHTSPVQRTTAANISLSIADSRKFVGKVQSTRLGHVAL